MFRRPSGVKFVFFKLIAVNSKRQFACMLKETFRELKSDVSMSMLEHCGFTGGTNISKEHSDSIFRAQAHYNLEDQRRYSDSREKLKSHTLKAEML
jgi:hypothetical protein